jgi:hypothetical protein
MLGLWHLAWVALVAAGWAQAVIDFVLRIHFIRPSLQIEPFYFGTGATLVVVTTGIGFVLGYVLGLTWNLLHRGESVQ